MDYSIPKTFFYLVDLMDLNLMFHFRLRLLRLLLIDYIEIVRHGKFLDANVNSKDILNNILNSNENIKNKLKKFIN